MKKILDIGFDTYVPILNILLLTTPNSAIIKKKIAEAKETDTILDATFGRKTRSVIITSSDQVILSAIQPDTIAKRYNKKNMMIENIPTLLNIGYDNYILDSIISLIVSINTSPIKRRVDKAKKENTLLDATFGHKTRSVIITKDSYVLTSSLLTDTLSKRFQDYDKNITNIEEIEEIKEVEEIDE